MGGCPKLSPIPCCALGFTGLMAPVWKVPVPSVSRAGLSSTLPSMIGGGAVKGVSPWMQFGDMVQSRQIVASGFGKPYGMTTVSARLLCPRDRQEVRAGEGVPTFELDKGWSGREVIGLARSHRIREPHSEGCPHGGVQTPPRSTRSLSYLAHCIDGGSMRPVTVGGVLQHEPIKKWGNATRGRLR